MSSKKKMGKREARAILFERAASLLESDHEEHGDDYTKREERLLAGEVAFVAAKIRKCKGKTPDAGVES